MMMMMLPERRTGSAAEDLLTRSLSPVNELSSTLRSLPSSSNPSAGSRSPTSSLSSSFLTSSSSSSSSAAAAAAAEFLHHYFAATLIV